MSGFIRNGNNCSHIINNACLVIHDTLPWMPIFSIGCGYTSSKNMMVLLEVARPLFLVQLMHQHLNSLIYGYK